MTNRRRIVNNLLKAIIAIGLLVLISALIMTIMGPLSFGRLLPSEATIPYSTLESYWNNPPPTPGGITYVEKETKNGWLFCPLLINEQAISLPGDKEQDVYRSIKNSLSFNIDGLYRGLLAESSFGGFNDADGYWIFLSPCLTIENLSPGLHSAKIEFTDTQGTIYSYTWAFKVIK
ncbi:MAG TPA: hypothetical protein VHL11_13780 [Phototrophicaceae bacterium]|nr:hypothetical protein [Phototrophicaceae bacterium]